MNVKKNKTINKMESRLQFESGKRKSLIKLYFKIDENKLTIRI